MHRPMLMRHRQEILFLLLLLLTLRAGPLQAQPDVRAPVHMRAHTVIMDENAGRFICRGQVRVQQPGISLQADQLEIRFAGKRPGRQLRSITGSGQPVIYRELHPGSAPVEARSAQVDYSARQGLIVFTGDPRIENEGNQLLGERIVYDLQARTATATAEPGSGGVRTILLPASELGRGGPAEDE